MKASIVELRYKMNTILKALARNESVTILYRGIEKGLLIPINQKKKGIMKSSDHPAFGMWKNKSGQKTVDKTMKELRKGRYDDL